MSTKFVPKHKGDKNPNPKLLKFVRKVTDRVPGKIKMTTDAPEYWGLACIFEDELDATTREAALDLLLDMLPKKMLKVREHRTYQLLHQWNAEKHYMGCWSTTTETNTPRKSLFKALPTTGKTVFTGFLSSFPDRLNIPI